MKLKTKRRKTHVATDGGVQIKASDPVRVATNHKAAPTQVLSDRETSLQSNHRKNGNPCAFHAGDWHQKVAPIDLDVLTLMSGRLYAFDKFINGLKALDYPKDRLHLLWYTNSDNPAFLALATSTALAFSKDGYDIRFVMDPSIRPTKHALREIQPEDAAALDHADVIANLYNKALEFTTRDVFFLEDDIVPEPAALNRILSRMQGNDKIGYSCAAVTDRHSPRKFIWTIVKNDDGSFGGVEMPMSQMRGTKKIDLGGLACVVMRRTALDKLKKPIMKMWPPSYLPPSLLGGCDIVLCYEMHNLGIDRVCDFGIQTSHIRSDGVAV